MTPRTIDLTSITTVPAPSREQAEAYMLEKGHFVANPESKLTQEWRTNKRFLVGFPGEHSANKADYFTLLPNLIRRLAEDEGRSQMGVYQEMMAIEVERGGEGWKA